MIASLPILPRNKTNVMINIPEKWVFNHSDFEYHQLQNSIFRNLQERVEYLEDTSAMDSPKMSSRRDKEAMLQFLGIEGLSINKVIESCINWGFRIASLCGVGALYMLVKVGTPQRNRRGVRRGDSSSIYNSAHSIV